MNNPQPIYADYIGELQKGRDFDPTHHYLRKTSAAGTLTAKNVANAF